MREDEYDDDDDSEHGTPGPRYSYRKRGGGKFDGTIKTVGVAFLISAGIGFVGMCFNVNASLSNLEKTQATQAVSMQFLREQVNDMKGEMNEFRGKVYRSDGSIAGDFSADERQSK